MNSADPASAVPPRYIRVHRNDNVAIVVNDGGLPAGTEFPGEFVLQTRVPQGHKVSLRPIPAGAPVVRYDVTIGFASRDIPQGVWVDESMLNMPGACSLEDLPVGTRARAPESPLEGYTFEGYRNPDGSVGTRNILAITTTVQCVSGVVEHAVERIRRELLPRYPRVDGVIGLEHHYGCGVAIDAPDAAIPIRTLRNLSLNPNFGGQVMVVGLGCEKLPPGRLFPPGSVPGCGGGLGTVLLQSDSHVGFESMVRSIVEMAEARLQVLNERKRETCSAADLVVGVQCGGSDAFSGVTANPAVGHAVDLLVRAGATVLFSENTEVRDGVAQLTARAATPEVAAQLVRELDWYDRYLQRGGADRSANTTPGNKMGGLANIVEKAMGSIVKSGSVPIDGVLAPGERAGRRGLLFASTPASDFICGTLQTAAGMNLHVFTTGRGTPYGLAAVPVVKVATRTELAERWHDLMDLDAGRIATGRASIESVGGELFELLLSVAGGRRTWAEHWGLANALALFNPGPVT
jgi:galactarate dehydratase